MLKGVLCRAVLFPKCVKKDVFDDQALLYLVDVHKNKTVYAMSLASRFFLKDESGAHEYGRRTAANINAAYVSRNNEQPPPDKRTHYLGFYDVNKDGALSLPTEFYNITIRHKVEHGERSHFNFEMHPKDLTNSSERDRRHDRTTAMEAMITRLRGPLRCNLPSEGDNGAHLKVELPTLPRSASIVEQVGQSLAEVSEVTP